MNYRIRTAYCFFHWVPLADCCNGIIPQVEQLCKRVYHSHRIMRIQTQPNRMPSRTSITQ